MLNGVPSIIWGMVVYALAMSISPMKAFSAWAGGIVLGLMMIPLIMRTAEEVLLLVPNGYREAAFALGISQWRTIVQIVMRTALKGIITGVLLALARVAGETAPLLFTALGNQYWNHNLVRSHRRPAAADLSLTPSRLMTTGTGRPGPAPSSSCSWSRPST